MHEGDLHDAGSAGPSSGRRPSGPSAWLRPAQTVDIDVMRGRRRVAGEPVRAPAQQGHRAARVAAPRVRQAHGQLGQALPEVSLGRRSCLPRGLQHLVRVEGPAVVKQLLGRRQRLRGGQRGRVRQRLLPGRIARQRAPERIPWPGIPGPPGRVPVAPGRAPGRASGPSLPGTRLAFRLGVAEPGAELQVEAFGYFLVREVTRAVQQPPPVRRFHVHT